MVVKAAFGASLYEQGRGFYVTLELLALAWGTSHRDEAPAVLPARSSKEALRVRVRGHDFARRLVADMLPPDKAKQAFGADENTSPEMTVRALLQGLIVPTNRRTAAKWGATHLYPYVGELIHYDAVDRRTGPNIERYMMRGGGGLAHRILRTDPNQARLAITRSGLGILVSDSGGSLGRLAAALAEQDEAKPRDFEDLLEPGETEDLDLIGDGAKNPWVHWLRQGVANILGRERLYQAKKIEALMHWVPYCIARYQLHCAANVLELPSFVLPVDMQSGGSSVREASRETLAQATGAINSALAAMAEKKDKAHLLARPKQTWREGSRAFFTGTLATVGALNAPSGKRHFCLRVSLLESFVLAALAPGEELPIRRFCRRLDEEFGLAIDADAAARSPSLDFVNRADFSDNEIALRQALRSLGMLREYSDATRMVGTFA
ncbi:MAG: hypothetical protein Q8K32_07020 [Archangium sp.]|nr:hypothetical protein [Archangium sp.]